jgi:hypothetical protein
MVLLAITLVAGYAAVRVLVAARARTGQLVVVYLLAGIAAIATLFANPYGLSIVDYYRALIGNRVVAEYIVEWRQPSLGSLVSIGFFLLLAAVIAITAYGVGRGYRPPPALVVIACFLALVATRGVRYQAWFALAGVLLAGETLAAVRPAPPELSARMRAVGAVAVAVFAVIGVSVLVLTKTATFEQSAPHSAMSAAAAYMAAHPGATILADNESASALLWLHPNTEGRVAFDARLEQYRADDLRNWFTYISGQRPGWPGLADTYDVLVASRRGNPGLVARLETESGWRTIADDDQGIALVRRGLPVSGA